jgi:acyl-CoA thioesterase-1
MDMNLRAMIADTQRVGARVLLVGMRLPPNYGPYAEAFAERFDKLSKESRIPLLPFLLAPIADKRQFFQADQLHPTADAQPRLLDHVWPSLQPLLKRSGGR